MRHANSNWELPESVTWEQASLAVLMDIRGELQNLNRLLHCANFLGIPHKLDQIRRNTAKPRKRKAKRK